MAAGGNSSRAELAGEVEVEFIGGFLVDPVPGIIGASSSNYCPLTGLVETRLASAVVALSPAARICIKATGLKFR